MTPISVAILGLGRLGASIGLALQRYNADKGARHQFQVSGYDEQGGAAAQAQKLGAVTSLANHPADAVRNRDIVVLAVPYAQTQATYRAIGGQLRAGAVVLDLAPLKGPSIKWAKSNLGTDAYMVGITPVLNPAYLFDGLDDAAHARADLFDSGAFLLMPSPRCAKDAVELAADFASIVGATPHFMDADEHDGLSAATEGLPALLGMALFHMLQAGQGWDDAQRITNPAFGRLTHHLAVAHPDDLRDLLLLNRRSTVVYLDRLMAALAGFRAILDSNNRDALEAALIESAEAYQAWLSKRERGKWDDERDHPRPSASLMSGLMGDYLTRRLRGDKKDE